MNKSEIANIVGKNFFKVCKSKKILWLVLKLMRKKNKFITPSSETCRTIYDLFKDFYTRGEYLASQHKGNKYDLIMYITNEYLRFYLDEKLGIQGEKLTNMGEKIFT